MGRLVPVARVKARLERAAKKFAGEFLGKDGLRLLRRQRLDADDLAAPVAVAPRVRRLLVDWSRFRRAPEETAEEAHGPNYPE